MNLTEKQTRFCQEYVVNLNARQAAIKAGYGKYTAASTASHLLQKPEIQDYVKELQQGIGHRLQINGDKVVQELACLAFANLLEFVTPDMKLKSIVGIKRIIIEEASQLSFEDFLELNRRARGMEGIQIIFILNPISENHWIKTKFCDEHGPYFDQTTVLRFTYRDNCDGLGKSFLTEADIRELERLKDINENQYRIYVEAEWGIDNKDSKFCWAFDRSQVKPTELDPDEIVWASFDFNVNPLTCTVAQVFPDTQTLRAIACIKLDNSDIWKMCDRLNAAYPDVLWMITGDATGQSRSAMVRDNVNYFHIIRDELNIGLPQMQVPTVNPPIEANRLMVNAVHKNWAVEIDPRRCQPLIYDLTYVEVTGTGEIIKDRSTTKKYADFLDNWRYLINMAVRPHTRFWQK